MGKIISNGIEYVGIVNFNMDYRAGIQAITSNNGASYNITFDKPLNTVDYNVYLQSVNYSGQGFATMGYAVSNRTINGFTFTVYNTSSFNAHDIGWIAIPQNSNGISTNDKINYSTTEQKTGQKWIDGKDIYQVTVHLESGDFTIGGRTDGISNGLSNVETIITKDAIGIHGNGSGTAYFSNYFPTSDGYVCQIFDIGATEFSIYVGSGFSTMTDIYVTFQYTKSTT